MTQYWYISAENPQAKDGKFENALDGPYPNEKTAQAMGFQIFPGLMFKKHKFPTSDRAKATAMWKHQMASTVGAFKALRPVRHLDKKEQ